MSDPTHALRVGDALGACLRDYLNHPGAAAETTALLEFDTGDRIQAPAATYFGGRSTWTPLDEWLMDSVRGDVLDIGVGVGRFAMEAARERAVSYVLGVDVSPGAVEIAQERGLDSVVGAFPGSMPESALARRPWRTIMLMGNNLGLLHGRLGPSAALTSLRELTDPDGLVVGTSGLPAHLPAGVRAASMARCGRAGAFKARLLYRGLATPWFAYEFFEPDHFAAAAARAGWDITGARRTPTQWGVKMSMSLPGEGESSEAP